MTTWFDEDYFPSGSDVDKAVRATMRPGAERVKGGLEEGTPVDSGVMRDSWYVEESSGSAMNVDNRAPYQEYVEIDTEPADREAARLSRDLGAAVNQLLTED